LKSLNAFHEKFLLYQHVTKLESEQTIKHAMIALLDDDYGREQKTILAQKVQQDNTLTVVSLINEIVALQNTSHRVNGKRNQAKSVHGKRKNNDDHDSFKRQNTSDRNGRNGNTFDRPVCPICSKRHHGRCTNQQALQRFRANRNASSNGNTSSLPVCDLCGKTGHTKANCHKDPKNSAAAAEWRAKRQQDNIRNGKPNFNGYKPKLNTNKVNNIDVNDTDVANDDVAMTDVVQNTMHIEPDDDLLDFDSD
jgi:hypothetical protein